MSDFLQFSVLLVVILVAAKLTGYLSTLIHQPAVFGELLIGVLLGPSLINILHLPFVTSMNMSDFISELGEIGVLLLMFLAGLELHINDLTKNARIASRASILGVALPVGMGYLLGRLIHMSVDQSLFLGLTLGATSVSISAQVLIELKLIKSKVGLALMSTAVLDDILVLLLFSGFLVFLSGSSGFIEILLVFGKMLLFLALSAGFGLWLLPMLTRWSSRLPISQSVATLAIVILLIYGLAAELLGGMAAITGTFIAGLMFARTPEKGIIETNLHAMAYAFFVPIFFVGVGLSVDLHSMSLNTLWLILAISVIAMVGKILGVGTGARITRFSWREALQLGIGMVSRGEVSLIIAKLGLDSGYISSEVFSAVIAMILITSLVTPPLLRAVFRSDNPVPPLKPAAEPGSDPEKESL
jgi:Kef-type K+ transport system membrane component KefB